MDGARVVCAPRVRLLITGEELAAPGAPKQPHQIYEANSWMLQALVVRDGGEIESVQRLHDDRPAIASALQAPGADVVLVSGGSSVGAADHAPGLVAELGELAIHGIAMRPASPTGLGTIAAASVFLLPGNPVSCLSAYDFFAGRLLRALAGRPAAWPYARQEAVLAQKVASAIGRVDYCRVRLEAGRVIPLALSGASILSSTTRADGFVVIPADEEGYPAGATVTVWRYDSPGGPQTGT
jgi:molybdopterin molybdotransferase